MKVPAVYFTLKSPLRKSARHKQVTLIVPSSSFQYTFPVDSQSELCRFADFSGDEVNAVVSFYDHLLNETDTKWFID